jgi:hypothetical protein
VYPRVKTIADPAVLGSLLRRFEALTPGRPRRWGTLTAPEMICHLGDATEMVLRERPRDRPLPARRRPVVKMLGLWTPVRWPRGWRTNPAHDPRAGGTRPTEFTADLARLCGALTRLAAARGTHLEPMHGVFGTMSTRDWQRWAYKHADHHLRQFGV